MVDNAGHPRILLIEDNFLLAELMARDLESEGYAVVGPAGRIAPALRLAQREQLDGAILDLNLEGRMSFDVARALAARGVPFVFITGYSSRISVPPELQAYRRFTKPVDLAELFKILKGFAARSTGSLPAEAATDASRRT